jgi:tripartite-type tricarboxylate transporter receptor subunit TctC
MQAVVAGDVQFNTDNIPQLLAQIKGGRVKALAVTSDKRWFQLPDVPTVAELGYPALTTPVWFSLVAQSSIERETLLRMNKAVNEVLAMPDFVAKLRDNSLQATPGTPEFMANVCRERTQALESRDRRVGGDGGLAIPERRFAGFIQLKGARFGPNP